MTYSHDRGVTKKRLAIENSLDEGFWQDYKVEHEYYAEDEAPVGPYPDEKGRMKGEFDVVAVNYDEKVFLYVEVKSNPGDLYKAADQLERAEEHFAPEREMIGQTWLEE